MTLFNACPSSGNFFRCRHSGFATAGHCLSAWALLALGALSPAGVSVALAQYGESCCGESVAVAAPPATQTYRLDFQTVYDEQQVTAYRVTYETVYDSRVYAVTKPVWETQTSERRYTVQRPVWETSTREERTTVMKPVYETQVRDMSYNVTRDVVETNTREERFTVMKPVYETAVQQQTSVVRRPVYETSERDEAYTVAEPITTLRTTYADQGGYVDQITPLVSPGVTQLGFVPGGWAVNPATGLMVWQRGGYVWTVTPGVVTQQVARVYQPNVVAMQIPETTVVNRVVTRKVPVQTVRYVDEQVVQQVPVQTMRMVAEEQVRQVPVQTVRKVVERIENKVPVQTMRMVAEEQVRQIPVQVCKMVSEDRVEPVSVQVCKYVTEQRTAQVPRIVEKKVPYTYTVRSPRTVVMRVPLDSCGNPVVSQSISGVSTGAVQPMQAASPAAPALGAAETTSTKTFSEKPAATDSRVEKSWQESSLDHVDPKQSSGTDGRSAVRAEKPFEAGANSTKDRASELRAIETIPAPAAQSSAPTSAPTSTPSRALQPPAAPDQEPTVAPLGPAVEPAPPANDTRDVPATETSDFGRGLTNEVSHNNRST